MRGDQRFAHPHQPIAEFGLANALRGDPRALQQKMQLFGQHFGHSVRADLARSTSRFTFSSFILFDDATCRVVLFGELYRCIRKSTATPMAIGVFRHLFQPTAKLREGITRMPLFKNRPTRIHLGGGLAKILGHQLVL